MRQFTLSTYADLSEVSALCLVLARGGYEVATTTDQTKTYLLVYHSSKLALRALESALSGFSWIESEEASS